MTDDARWLSDREQESWLGLLTLMARVPAAVDAQLQRDAGLNSFEYSVLAMLSEQPERTVQLKSLAFLANGSLSRLSHVLTRLERRGLVQRKPAPDDGRATVASLTDAGWNKIVDTAPGHVEEVRSLVFDKLSARQIDQLTAIIDRLVPDRPRRAADGVSITFPRQAP